MISRKKRNKTKSSRKLTTSTHRFFRCGSWLIRASEHKLLLLSMRAPELVKPFSRAQSSKLHPKETFPKWTLNIFDLYNAQQTTNTNLIRDTKFQHIIYSIINNYPWESLYFNSRIVITASSTEQCPFSPWISSSKNILASVCKSTMSFVENVWQNKSHKCLSYKMDIAL